MPAALGAAATSGRVVERVGSVFEDDSMVASGKMKPRFVDGSP